MQSWYITTVGSTSTDLNGLAYEEPSLKRFLWFSSHHCSFVPTILPQSVGRQMGYPENLSRRRNAQTSGKVKREEPLTKIQSYSAREFPKVRGSVQCAGIPQILVGPLLWIRTSFSPRVEVGFFTDSRVICCSSKNFMRSGKLQGMGERGEEGNDV